MYFNNMNTITSFVNAPCVTFYAELAIHFFFLISGIHLYIKVDLFLLFFWYKLISSKLITNKMSIFYRRNIIIYKIVYVNEKIYN